MVRLGSLKGSSLSGLLLCRVLEMGTVNVSDADFGHRRIAEEGLLGGGAHGSAAPVAAKRARHGWSLRERLGSFKKPNLDL